MQVHVGSKNAEHMAELFRKAPKVAEVELQKAVNASVQQVFTHATQENLPWKTGRLTRSFGEGIEIGRLYGAIGPTVEYALAVHEKSSKPNYMPRIAGLAEPKVVEYFETAAERVLESLTK